MPLDVEALADLVVLTIKTSLGPVLERLAAVDARVSMMAGAEPVLADLRDRIVAVETKVAMPAPAVPSEDFISVRDRLVALETRTTGPSAADTALVDVRERVAAVERRVQEDLALKECGALRERLAVIETRAPVPGPAGHDGRDGKDASDVSGELTKELSLIRERVAVMEVRGQIPGPPGKDGTSGKDGQDGVGFDDLMVVQDGDRALTVRGVRGDRIKDLGTLTFPVEIYRGVYLDGKMYEPGDSVTWGGSEWHCNEATTTKPGDGSKAWTLKVKRGRDGKDGRDAPSVPVVSIGRGAA